MSSVENFQSLVMRHRPGEWIQYLYRHDAYLILCHSPAIPKLICTASEYRHASYLSQVWNNWMRSLCPPKCTLTSSFNWYLPVHSSDALVHQLLQLVFTSAFLRRPCSPAPSTGIYQCIPQTPLFTSSCHLMYARISHLLWRMAC